MNRRARFDPAASNGRPSAINTIPKNGGGNGKNTTPISTQIAPANIKAIDFKCFTLRTLMPSDHPTGVLSAHYLLADFPCQKNVQRHLINRGIAIVVV
jgi:hypothetical protein